MRLCVSLFLCFCAYAFSRFCVSVFCVSVYMRFSVSVSVSAFLCLCVFFIFLCLCVSVILCIKEAGLDIKLQRFLNLRYWSTGGDT